MAYGRKYYKEFDGYNAATGQTYSVLVDIYEDGFVGAAIEIEKVSASPLQLSLDSSGDPLYTSIKKTSAAFNIINTGQFDYSEFYTSNAKKYKMLITSTVFNWTGYLVPQAVSFDLATNGEFTLTASDGLHLLQSIDYKANENEMTTLSAFLTDVETKIGLSTFNRTSTVNTEYGDIWNSLIYKGMLVGKTYEEAFEMVLKAIGMQVRYWKITPIISIESALHPASVKCTNEYPELNFLAPIKTAKLNRNITTLPSAFKNALVDDASDLTPRAANSYNTLTNWTVVSDNGLVVFDIGANETDRKANKYKYINMFVKPTNATYDTQRLTGNEGSYFQLRPVQKTPFTLSFNANFGRISEYGRSSADGYRAYTHPVKWSSIKWGLYDSVSNKSFNKTSAAWDITGTPTAANANELKVTNPADSFVDVYIPIPAPSGATANLRFYLFTGAVEYVNAAPVGESRTNRLSIQSIDIDGEYVVSENELYTAVNGAVAVGDNIDVLDYDVDLGSVPVPPLNTSLYYGSAFFDNNLNQLEDIIIGANTVSHEQYLFNTILYTQNEIRKKVYTANVNMLTNVSPFWLKTTLKSDVVMVNACSFDFKTSQLNGEFTEIMPYVYREWTITSESEIGSSDWGGSGGQTGGSSGGGTVDTSNFVVKTGATDQTIEGIVRTDNLLSNGAVVAKSLAPTDVNEWPQAGSGVDGVVKYDDLTIKRNAQGQLYVTFPGGSDASFGTEVVGQSLQLIIDSVTKTLSLSTHTHNYQPLDADLTAIAALTGTSGLLKKTAADTWVLDTTAYLASITKTMVENVLTGNITSHQHNYLPISGGNLTGPLTILTHTAWHAGNDGAGSGLDAGLLCGRSAELYFKTRGGNMTNINDQSLLVDNSTCYWTPYTVGRPNSGYGVLLNISDDITWFNQFGFGTDNSIYFRQSINSSTNFGAWRTLAFTDSNVASATKLANTRTIWGQNFNGEGNVSGAITNATTGTFSSTISATTGIFSNLNANYIPKHTVGGLSNSLIYDNGTSVGISTSSPSNKLTVKSESSGLLDKQAIKWENDTLVLGYIGSDSNAYNSGAIRLSVNGVADQTVISANGNSWLNGGNVGIGTSDPTSKLHVIGEIKIESHNTGLGAINIKGNSTSCGFGFGNAESVNNMGFLKFKPTSVGSGSASNRIAFDIYGNDNLLNILGNGNVGVGTTDPQYKLDVNGTFRTTGAAYLNSTLSVAGHAYFANGTTYYINSAGSANLNALSCASTATFNSDILIPRENAWGYIKNTSVLGGIKIGTGNASGTYVDAISITTSGNFVRSEIPFIANVTLSVTGASTLTGLLTANGGIGSTTGTFSSYLTANRFYTGYDSGYTAAISCRNWFRSDGTTGWMNDTYGAGIYADTYGIVRTFSTNKFKVYNAEADSIYTLGGVLADGAVVAKYLSASYGVDWPVMTASVQGVAKAGNSLIANAGTLDMRNRHYTTTSSYTDSAVREITAEISIGTGSLLNTETMSLSLPFLPSSTTKSVTGNIVINPTTWAGAGLTVTFLNNGTNWVAFITNCSGATVNKDGIKLSVQAKQTV